MVVVRILRNSATEFRHLARNFFENFFDPLRAFLYLARCDRNRAVDSHDARARLARDHHIARQISALPAMHTHDIVRDREFARLGVALATNARHEEVSA